MHFACGRKPLPAIRDAAYRKYVGGGPSHGSRQHAQTFGKDRTCGSGDILADRQTDTHTETDRQTYSSQYFATVPAGEVKKLIADSSEVLF